MDSGVTFLVSPIPGVRLKEGGEDEDGSMLAIRKGGDEILFASWEFDETEGQDARGRGMVWIPITEFSADPDQIMPPDMVPLDDVPQETGITERGGSPMGGGKSGGLKRRPTTEG